MKYTISVIVSLVLALVLMARVTAQTSNSGSGGAVSGAQDSYSASQQNTEKAKKLHLPQNFSGDDAYKQNCTRCHSEVPKLDPPRTNTIMRHMRVRANLTKDEAQGILDYLRE